MRIVRHGGGGELNGESREFYKLLAVVALAITWLHELTR